MLLVAHELFDTAFRRFVMGFELSPEIILGAFREKEHVLEIDGESVGGA